MTAKKAQACQYRKVPAGTNSIAPAISRKPAIRRINRESKLILLRHASALRLPAQSAIFDRTSRHRSVEEHRRSSFIAFGGPRAKAGLSPGGQAEACPTWDKLQLVQASQARPGPQGHDRSLAFAAHHSHHVPRAKSLGAEGGDQRVLLLRALCHLSVLGFCPWL